jgi:hypothetical protein
VILSIWHDQRKARETIDDLIARLRPRESLQQLLDDEPSRHDVIAGLDRTQERPYFGNIFRLVASQRERPNACINEQTQRRVRSFL